MEQFDPAEIVAWCDENAADAGQTPAQRSLVGP
jgi:hypothetical protein